MTTSTTPPAAATSPDGTPLPTPLEPGTVAPTFTLPTNDGATFDSSSLRGRRAIVFTYPQALSPGCTGEVCDFRDSYSTLVDAGYALVGISSDAPERNARFIEAHALPFPLLSDEDHAVQTAFGTYGMRNKYGRWKVGPIRSTFVLDEEGLITHVFTNHQAKGHVGRLRKALGLAVG